MGGLGNLYAVGASPSPPLDMPYLAATLTEAGLPVRVHECGALRWSLEELCDALNAGAGATDALLVVRTSLPTIDWDLEVCAALRTRCRPARILIYGPVVTPLLWRV